MMANEREPAGGLHAEVKEICLRGGGLEACRKIAEHVETEVQHLANAINKELADHVAVIFVGSSARGEMCLHSDVDYLVLLDAEGRKDEAKKLKDAINGRLKDNELGTNSSCLGVEPASAFRERARVNFLFRLVLYDMQFVWGKKSLFRRFKKDVGKLLAKTKPNTLIEMLFIYRRFRRSARFDAPWPDLKSGRGGIRDLQFIIQVAKIEGARGRGIEECIQFLYLPEHRIEYADLIKASNFIFRVRNLLHGQPERTDDILDKRGLKFICDGSAESPFQLMSEYRRQAGVIYSSVVALKKRMRREIDEKHEKTQPGWTRAFKDAESSTTLEKRQIAFSNAGGVLRLAVAWNSKSPTVLRKVMNDEKHQRDWSVLYALAYNLYSPLDVYAFLLKLADKKCDKVYDFIVREAVRNPMVELVEEGTGSDKAEVDIRKKVKKAKRYLDDD